MLIMVNWNRGSQTALFILLIFQLDFLPVENAEEMFLDVLEASEYLFEWT